MVDLRLEDKRQEVSGWELVILAKSHRQLLGVPIILCTADLWEIKKRAGRSRPDRRRPRSEQAVLPRRHERPRHPAAEQRRPGSSQLGRQEAAAIPTHLSSLLVRRQVWPGGKKLVPEVTCGRFF